jgi:hypothetical protein
MALYNQRINKSACFYLKILSAIKNLAHKVGMIENEHPRICILSRSCHVKLRFDLKKMLRFLLFKYETGLVEEE